MGLYRRKDSPNWWYKFKIQGHDKPLTGSTETFDRKLAESIMNAVKSDALRGKHFGKTAKITLADLAKKYLERCQLQPSYPQKKIYFETLFGFKELKPNRMAASITRDDCKAYQLWRQTTAMPGTVNRELGTLRNCFNMAIRDMNMALLNPVSGLKFLSERESRRERFLSTEEKLKFFGDPKLSKEVKDLCLFAIKTGMRQGEIRDLKWQDVDFKNKLIRVLPGKSIKTRFVPMHPQIEEMLKFMPHKGEQVFSNSEGLKMSRHGIMRTGFEAACERLGIKNLHFHDLRHTFASDFVMAGGDMNTLAEYMGHSTIRMTERYAHLSPQYRESKIALLPQESAYLPHLQVI